MITDEALATASAEAMKVFLETGLNIVGVVVGVVWVDGENDTKVEVSVTRTRIEGSTPEGDQERMSQIRRGVIEALWRLEKGEEKPRTIGTIDFGTKRLDS